MDVREITTKSALVSSKIPGVDYVANPFLGCAHGCRYCYAVFMRKYSHHARGRHFHLGLYRADPPHESRRAV
ncbi:MAG: hypothetical protein ACOC6K_01735 [Thermodesulfobacteriota bacterium]